VKTNESAFKGIVSRDFAYVFWCHSLDLKLRPLTERIRLLFKFRFVSNFSIFASRRSELTLDY
jgi:hypothetical protein